ncbi:MAG: hypothetical protein U1F43_26370 [Myxococcota bacterium]
MRYLLIAILAPFMLTASGCWGAYVDCDGDECDYAPAPVRYEARPQYSYRKARVYDVDGRYYRQYGNDRRWVRYRRPPPKRHLHQYGPDHPDGWIRPY